MLIMASKYKYVVVFCYKKHSEAKQVSAMGEDRKRDEIQRQTDSDRKRGTEKENAHQQLIVPSSARKL